MFAGIGKDSTTLLCYAFTPPRAGIDKDIRGDRLTESTLAQHPDSLGCSCSHTPWGAPSHRRFLLGGEGTLIFRHVKSCRGTFAILLAFPILVNSHAF